MSKMEKVVLDDLGSVNALLFSQIMGLSNMYCPKRNRGSGSKFITDFIDSLIDGESVSLVEMKNVEEKYLGMLGNIFMISVSHRLMVEDALRMKFRQ